MLFERGGGGGGGGAERRGSGWKLLMKSFASPAWRRHDRQRSASPIKKQHQH